MSALTDVLATVKARIVRFKGKGINEQDTKGGLIEPVLRALGWIVDDLDEVQREYKQKKQDKPVDYALLLLRNPCLFVEAKALGENLDDRKWANQIMGYASVAGIEWVVLTEGDEYRIYNSHAAVPIDEKLFRSVRISDDEGRAAETLALLSKDRISENEINVLWNAHFVDRQVRAAVEQLFATDPEPDPSIVRLISKRVNNLTATDVKASLRRAQIHFDFPVEPSALPLPKRRPTTKVKTQQQPKLTDEEKGRVTLQDVIDAGLLNAPLQLERHYKGHDLKAELLPDGTVAFQREKYRGCSEAAGFACGTITGRPMNTNGWTFWQFRDGANKLTCLDEARQEFIKRHRKAT